MASIEATEIRRLHRVVRENNGDAFMRFWKTVNSILKSHGLPEMLYGEAKGYWEEHQGWEG